MCKCVREKLYRNNPGQKFMYHPQDETHNPIINGESDRGGSRIVVHVVTFDLII